MHRRADIFHAVETLRQAGFQNISIDLIAGLPHQSRESWEGSLTELQSFARSTFPFICWKSTKAAAWGKNLWQGAAVTAPGQFRADDEMADFYESACTRLAANGYEHYEISNWALPGLRSRHNLKYWRREPYIGFGAGAHSFDGRTRWANLHDSARYVACIEQGISPREQIEGVTAGQALEEEFFLGLRQLEGIDLARIEREYDAELPGRVSDFGIESPVCNRRG